MSDPTEHVEPVRVVHHGDPESPHELRDPHPEHERIVPCYEPPPLPVVDAARIVDEVATRRLVVVDRQNRERIVAEEDRHGNMTLRIASRGNVADLLIEVGEGEDIDGEPYVVLSISNAAGEVRIDGDGIDVERREHDAPMLKLHHDGVERHHWHSQVVPSEPEPLLDSPEDQVDRLLESLGLQDPDDE